MSSSVVFPVQVLREHITGLEAAISVCLATPDGKPVHKLRTETRRAEALLLLLALVPGLPEHRKEASALLRSLAKLRRAAGEVRDLDVHRKMLEEFSEPEQPEATSAASSNGTGTAHTRKSAKSGSRKPARNAEAAAREDSAALLDAAIELRKHMGRQRHKAAVALQNLLKDRQAKTARASEKLLKVLDPAKDLALPAGDLLRDAESVLSRDGLLKPDAIAALKEDDLHSVRKAAKAARYLAESLPEDQSLVEAARRFEELQEAGGQWHDALELARAARRYFGKAHELTAAYREQRDRNLAVFRAALTARIPRNARQEKRKPASAKRPASRGRAAA